MTKEELRQIFYLNKEIKMYKKELERLQCKSLVKCPSISDIPFGSMATDKVSNIAIEIADTEKIIEGMLLQIQKQKKKIIEYIMSIDDSIMRQIIFLRNVSCLPWQTVADEIGGDNTENSVKKIYSRFFQKNKSGHTCHDKV